MNKSSEQRDTRVVREVFYFTQDEYDAMHNRLPQRQAKNKYIADAILEKIAKENAVLSDLSTILDVVSEIYSVGITDIKGKSRKGEICMARHAYCYFAKRYTRITLKDIGNEIGGRDHSTALHSVRTIVNCVDKPYKGIEFWGYKDAKKQSKMFYEAKNAIESILKDKESCEEKILQQEMS